MIPEKLFTTVVQIRITNSILARLSEENLKLTVKLGIYFDQEGTPLEGTLKVQAKQVSLFPIIPSVTWNFKF